MAIFNFLKGYNTQIIYLFLRNRQKFVGKSNFICYNEKNKRKEECRMFNWLGDFFKELFNLIPKLVYLLYTSFISLIDLVQLLFRKLAGLDVYYVDGQPVGGDIVTNFIQGILGIRTGYGGSEYVDTTNYSALSTVFWAFVIFGLVVCFVSTLIAIFKSHYSYNEKSAKGPMPIIASAGKAVLNMVAVPVIIVLGLWLSQAILTALDSITSTTSSDIISIYGDDKQDLLKPVQYMQNGETHETYLYYDMFGYTAQIRYGDLVLDIANIAQPSEEDMARVAARSQTFSGSIFKVAAYNANRIRTGMFVTGDNTVNPNVSGFESSNSGGQLSLFGNYETIDEAADMVDTAFANFLHLNDTYNCNYGGGLDKDRYFTTWTTTQYSSFSKFNVGLVWYYYDLWNFNFIVGFGAAIVCIVLFFNIILGLMTRFFMSLILFFVMPPLAGLAPLDNGKAFGTWRETFMKQVLMAYGAVVGMNLVLILLPFVNEIDFFNIEIADLIAQTLFIIVGLITIKAAISTLSALIGAEDANAAGDKINKEVGAVAGKAVSMTMGAAKVAGKAFMNLTPVGLGVKAGARAAGAGAGFIGGKIRQGVGALGSKIGGTKFGRGLKVANAFLKGGTGAARAQHEMDLANKDIKDADKVVDQAKKEDFLAGLDGKEMSDAEMKQQALENGFTKSQASKLIKNTVRDGHGKIMGDATTRNYAAKDKRFAAFHYQKEEDKVESYVNADDRKQGAEHRRQAASDLRAYHMANPSFVGRALGDLAPSNIIKNAGASGADIAKQFMANFKTGITQQVGVNEFMENSSKGIKAALGVKDKPKPEEVTAENTAELGEKFDALNKTLTELTNEMRQDRHKGS